MWWVVVAWAGEPCIQEDLDAATQRIDDLWQLDEDLDGALAEVQRVVGVASCLRPVDAGDLLDFHLLATEIAVLAEERTLAEAQSEAAVRYANGGALERQVSPDVGALWERARVKLEAQGRVALTIGAPVLIDGVPHRAGEQLFLLRGAHLGQYLGEQGWVSEELRVEQAMLWPAVSEPVRWPPARVGMMAGGVGLVAAGVVMLALDGSFLQNNARYGDPADYQVGAALLGAGVVSAAAGAGLLLGVTLHDGGGGVRVQVRF